LKLYDFAMRRWGVSFREIEEQWTDAEFFGLIQAAREIEEDARDASRSDGPRQIVETMEQRAARLVREQG
jgi:hypothetical protein